MSPLGRFPFGAPVLRCGNSQPESVDAFVLGAYPSAVHVRWVPPKDAGLPPIAALAVDNEPSVFWDGDDADARVQEWKSQYFDPAWGTATTAHLNGPSGSWLEENVLAPLRGTGATRHFVTDCLTTYRLSTDAATRLADTYEPMVAMVGAPLRSAELRTHPSESQIVKEALHDHAERLLRQIDAAQPSVVVTLGNAASRVINTMAGLRGTGKLTPDGYGTTRTIELAGVSISWLALVHPATPPDWQLRHRNWLDGGVRL